jgi:hypothetical protein
MPNAPLTQMRTFHLEAPLARVFPLFTAEAFLTDEHYTRMIEEWQAATRKALRLPVTP